MLSSVFNRFSARAEHLHASVAQLVAQRDAEISPFEEEEQWLRRRLRVLDLQFALLCENPRPGPETPDDRYQAALNALAREFVGQHRQRLDSRLSDIVPRLQDGRLGGEVARREHSIRQFEERVAREMESHRGFRIDRPAPQQQELARDLDQERQSLQTILRQLEDSIAAMSDAMERTASGLTERMANLRREREAAQADIHAHENWLTACRQGDLHNVIEGMGAVPANARADFINRLGNGGRNGLHFACEANELVIAGLLRSAGGRLDAPTDRGRLPIHLACRRDLGEPTRMLLSWLRGNGADLNACDGNGRGPLNEAAHHGNLTAVLWLLKHGSALTACDRHRRTALHVAAAAGHREVVDQLLALGADPSSINGAGERPLVEAIRNGHAVVAQVFLDRGLWLTATESAALRSSAAWTLRAVRHAFYAPLERQLSDQQAQSEDGAGATPPPMTQ